MDNNQIDEDGFMKVRIGGDVVRRRSISHYIFTISGDIVCTYVKPELQKNEILLEVIGGMPEILQPPA